MQVTAERCSSHGVMTEASGLSFVTWKESVLKHEAQVIPTILSLNKFPWGFPAGSDGKVSAYKAGDPGSIPGSGKSSGEEMAPHSSPLAWKIPWTEEPGGLLSMRLPRIGHD